MRRHPWLAIASLSGAILFCAPCPARAQVQARVEADRAPVDRLAGFYQRKALGHGTFLGPEDLAKRPVARTADLLRMIPGMQVSTRTSSASPVTSRHCTGIGYFVDGLRARGFNPIDTINPDDLLAIEVYKSPAQIPAQFQEKELCAAILVWTKGG